MMEIRVPATSANMGPGFDCLGIALNMYNRFFVEEIESGLKIYGCEKQFQNENNLFYCSMKKCFEKVGYKEKGIKIVMDTKVPVSRGLGSSATCIIGGIVAANEISGRLLSNEDILEMATEIEGHPDNLTPALVGGMTVAISENNKVYYQKIIMGKKLKFYALIPEKRFSTDEARKVLPEKIPLKEGIFNIGRAALLVATLANGNCELLKVACKDKLHQDYRGKFIANYFDIVKKCQEKGTGVFLSGAGPTIMVMSENKNSNFLNDMKIFLSNLDSNWSIKELKVDDEGTKVIYH